MVKSGCFGFFSEGKMVLSMHEKSLGRSSRCSHRQWS